MVFIVDSLAVLQATFGDSLQRQDQERRHGGDFFFFNQVLILALKPFFKNAFLSIKKKNLSIIICAKKIKRNLVSDADFVEFIHLVEDLQVESV